MASEPPLADVVVAGIGCITGEPFNFSSSDLE